MTETVVVSADGLALMATDVSIEPTGRTIGAFTRSNSVLANNPCVVGEVDELLVDCEIARVDGLELVVSIVSGSRCCGSEAGEGSSKD